MSQHNEDQMRDVSLAKAENNAVVGSVLSSVVEPVMMSALQEETAPVTPVEKRLGKTDSLKRFFKSQKMPSLPQMHSKAVGVQTIEKDNVMPDDAIEEDLDHKEIEQKSDQMERFNLRVNSGAKHAAANLAEMDKAGTSASASSSMSKQSTSKMSLKASISSFWHSVFKRHGKSKSGAGKSGETTSEQSGSSDSDGDGEQAGRNSPASHDELHTLKLSDDPIDEKY